MKAPKKPKYAAMPKAPQMKASEQAWKNYDAKVKAVTAANLKKKAEYEKKLKEYESELKKRQSIKDKAAAAKAKL